MKKVLYCASNWSHIYCFHFPYIAELENNGFEVHVATSGIPNNSDLSHPYELPIKKKILSFSNLKVIFMLVYLIRREQYKLIYVHTTLAAFLLRIALLLSVVRDVRLVYMCHGYFFELGRKRRIKKDIRSIMYFLCEKLLAAQTTTLLLMNREDFESARRYGFCKDIRFCHGMGISSSRYILLGEKKNDLEINFLCIGEFSKRKNQIDIIKAFARLLDLRTNCKMFFAGDGVNLENCKQLAHKLGISDSITFCGHVSDVSSLYSKADALITASKCEGLPFCVMEALHFGLPVIASSIKGHSDLIDNNRNGFLYNSTGDLLNCMIKLASKDEISRLSKQAALPEEYYIDATMIEFRELFNLPVKVPV